MRFRLKITVYLILYLIILYLLHKMNCITNNKISLQILKYTLFMTHVYFISDNNEYYYTYVYPNLP